MFIFAPEMARSCVGGWQKTILWNETSGQLYGQSRKDVFNTLPVCDFKLRNFESRNSGDATETSTFGLMIISHPAPDLFPLYI